MKILLYTSYLHTIGGIETFILSFIDMFSLDHEVEVMCPKCHEDMAKLIPVKLYEKRENVDCDVLVMVRMGDEIPYNVSYKKSIRMCHCMKTRASWNILQDCDAIVHVSEASRNSFHSQGVVIHNPSPVGKKINLLFVSATRVPATDKGKNTDRILKFARKMEQANIPFIWLNFSDAPIENAPKGFFNVGTYHDIGGYIAKADYLVQLSDHEGFGYSVLEALTNNTAVICTPFETIKELGVEDGINGYVVPFDLDFDMKKLYNVPSFEYHYHNDEIKEQWEKLFRMRSKRPKKDAQVMVEATNTYKDLQFGRMVRKGERFVVTYQRAQELRAKGLVREVL